MIVYKERIEDAREDKCITTKEINTQEGMEILVRIMESME
jgi:hypothetical protein